MNFKTTIILLLALIVAGGVFWFTGGNKKTDVPSDQNTPIAGKKLIDLDPADIQKVTIITSDGNRTTIVKSGDNWNLTEPLAAPAVQWSAQGLVSALSELGSLGRPDTDPGPDSGLSKPQYQVEFTTTDGRSYQVAIGNKTTVGDLQYVQINNGEINLISTTFQDVLKSATNDLRDKHLIPINLQDIQQFRIIKGDQTISMARIGGKWRVLQPVQIPGDEELTGNVLKNLTALQATEFLPSDSSELAYARFDKPNAQVWFSTNAPTTQPASTLPSTSGSIPAGEYTLTVGSPDSLLKDRYYVQTSAGETGKLDGNDMSYFMVTPDEVRDRNIFSLIPANVTQISILKETYPTLPPGQKSAPGALFVPLSSQHTVLQRRPQTPAQLGPKLSGATTQPATQPTDLGSVWQIADDPKPVDDSKVDALLAAFKSLRATTYDSAPPAGSPSVRYVIRFTLASGSPVDLTIVKTPDSSNPVGFFNGLVFELSSDLLDTLDADLHKPV